MVENQFFDYTKKCLNVVNSVTKFTSFVYMVIYSFDWLKLRKYNEQRYSTNF